MKKNLLAALLLLTTLPAFTQAQNAWTNTFTINILKRSIPAIPTKNITINVLEGETASGSILLQNNGNLPINFTAVRGAGIDPVSLEATWKPLDGWVNVPIGSDRQEAAELPPVIPLGFIFPFLDQRFSTAQIYTSGSMQLDFALTLQPFFAGNVTIDNENLGFLRKTDLFIAAWQGARTTDGRLNDLQFQVQFYKSGEIRYLYRSMNGATTNDATIGYNSIVLETEKTAEVEESTSVLANDSMLVLAPKFLLTLDSDKGSVSGGSTTPLTFTVDATDPAAESETYFFIIDWGNGLKDTVSVNVIIKPPAPALTVSPATLLLEGPAGSLTKNTSVTVKNTGNVDIDYFFLNTAAQKNANYTWTPNASFNWNETAGLEFVPLDDAAKDNGITDALPLGFAFPYYGTFYTNFQVAVDGHISLGDDPNFNQIVAPLWRDLQYDDNSRIYASGDRRLQVVTWENMTSPNGADQTFQLILESNGTIKFQYLRLDGINDWITSGDIRNGGIGIKDTDGRRFARTLAWIADNPDDDSGTFINKEIITGYTTVIDRDQVKTVPVFETVKVYDDPLLNQAFTFVPADTAITVSPGTGPLAPGESQQITVTGDARGLSNGDQKKVTYNVRAPNAAVQTLNVTFDIKNPSPAILAMDSDGDGQSDLAEFMAGTDARDADSSFRLNMDGSRTISWTEPDDGLNRTYTIWYTTNLLDGWQELATVKNLTGFTDEEHNDVPAIYYKVTVE